MLKIENIDVYYGAIHAVKNVSFEVGEGEIVALIGANGAGKSTILKTVSGLMHPRSGSITFCDQNITHVDAIHAVKNVSFEVGEGEIVALIGANGAGKSTILKTVSGLMHPRSGSITFCDQNITHVDAYKLLRTGLAHVPEGRRIFLQMTVQENLEMGAYIRKSVADEDLEKVFTYFPRLKERRKQIAGTLSGGEQQMLAMSRALMSHPKLMMLDEPSMGLAPIIVDQVFGIIKELHKSGTTILLVEQNARKALQIADRAYVLETGSITLSGTGAELSKSDEVRKAYLGG